MLLLLPIQFKVGLIREDRFDEFLQNVSQYSRSKLCPGGESLGGWWWWWRKWWWLERANWRKKGTYVIFPIIKKKTTTTVLWALQTFGSLHKCEAQGKNWDVSRKEVGFACRWPYLEADVPAALPHHLQLGGLAVASLPQLQPHLIIDVKQVMGVVPRVVQHFLGQRSGIATEEAFTHFPQQQQQHVSARWVLRLAWPPLLSDSLTAKDRPLLHSRVGRAARQ